MLCAVTVLLEYFTDYSIRVSRSCMDFWGGRGNSCPLPESATADQHVLKVQGKFVGNPERKQSMFLLSQTVSYISKH